MTVAFFLRLTVLPGCTKEVIMGQKIKEAFFQPSQGILSITVSTRTQIQTFLVMGELRGFTSDIMKKLVPCKARKHTIECKEAHLV